MLPVWYLQVRNFSNLTLVLFCLPLTFSPGSVDTTVAAINTFYAAMLLFPDVQRKAKQELDRVLGGRLPEISDEKDIPYITALVKEIFRYVKFTILLFC